MLGLYHSAAPSRSSADATELRGDSDELPTMVAMVTKVVTMMARLEVRTVRAASLLTPGRPGRRPG